MSDAILTYSPLRPGETARLLTRSSGFRHRDAEKQRDVVSKTLLTLTADAPPLVKFESRINLPCVNQQGLVSPVPRFRKPATLQPSSPVTPGRRDAAPSSHPVVAL